MCLLLCIHVWKKKNDFFVRIVVKIHRKVEQDCRKFVFKKRRSIRSHSKITEIKLTFPIFSLEQLAHKKKITEKVVINLKKRP